MIKKRLRRWRREIRFPYSPYMDKHKCIFIHIPRTGGTSIRAALGAPPRGRAHLPWYIYQKANPDKFRAYFKFAFVRHPETRILSAFNYLRRGGNGRSDSKAAKCINEYRGFNEFVKSALEHGPFLYHELFCPQWYFLFDYDGELKVNFLGYSESFSSDSATVLDKLGLGEKIDQTNQSYESGREYTINSDTIKLLREIYRLDYQLLGYS